MQNEEIAAIASTQAAVVVLVCCDGGDDDETAVACKDVATATVIDDDERDLIKNERIFCFLFLFVVCLLFMLFDLWLMRSKRCANNTVIFFFFDKVEYENTTSISDSHIFLHVSFCFVSRYTTTET